MYVTATARRCNALTCNSSLSLSVLASTDRLVPISACRLSHGLPAWELSRRQKVGVPTDTTNWTKAAMLGHGLGLAGQVLALALADVIHLQYTNSNS